MSKRPLDHDDFRPPKRQKPTNAPPKPPQPEEVHTARQLQTLLAFNQDAIPELRIGIASFKAFLESILYYKDEDNRGRQLTILREYLYSEKPDDPNSKETPFLTQLWQAWSFASHNNNEQLVSSITALFALLVKTLSSLLEFKEQGLLLCRTLLQHQHLRLVKRSLEAPKQKDFLISPALRLLIEVSGFDGGGCARGVWRGREWCFDAVIMRRLVGSWKSQSEEDAKRRPALRTLTIRYIINLLKHLHEGAKTELLNNRSLCGTLFHFLNHDPSDIVAELLNTVEQQVLKDDDLPRSAKAGILGDEALQRVTEIAVRSSEEHLAAARAFEWLTAVCTKPSYGLLRPSGWYPPGTSSTEDKKRRKDAIDLGLDSIDFYDRSDKPNVHNSTMLSWLQTLRPHSNLKERELVLTCFKSAPELVAAYFAEKPLQLDPKLSNTWIGYASFVFEVIRLQVPRYFGHDGEWAQIPPQTFIMLDSILPRPLTQKILTRCLNQSSELITFFAMRILILALQKLAEVKQLISKAAESAEKASLWQEASERLSSAFVERFPNMKDVVAAFRQLPNDEEHALQQEGFTRLLRLYYEVLPLQAMEEQVDVSAALCSALEDLEQDSIEQQIRQLRMLRLEHLLQVARNSPGMKWFTKQGSLKFSPVVSILDMHVREQNVGNRQIRDLVAQLLKINNVLETREDCDILVAVLSQLSREDVNQRAAVLTFLDDCFGRVMKKPIKYVDDLEAIFRRKKIDNGEEADPPASLSLLVAVFVEQAPFLAKKQDSERQAIETLICSFIALSLSAEQQKYTLKTMKKLLTSSGGLRWQYNSSAMHAALERVRSADTPAQDQVINTNDVDKDLTPFAHAPVESEDHPELLKWAQKDLELALEDRDIAALMLCLSSQYPEIRSQGLGQLHKLEDKLLASSIEDRDPIYVLVGELIETYEHHFRPNQAAVPYLGTCFATHALEIQRQPLGFMYPKINAYLNKGPEWRVHKLPTYWLDNTVLSQPEEDDAYWKEALWVLEWLVDGLRTVQDLELLRKAGVFERLMGLYSSPQADRPVREKIVEVLWRASAIKGGADTLVTRTGVLAWLAIIAKKNNKTGYEQALWKRIKENCDGKRIEEWADVCELERLFNSIPG